MMSKKTMATLLLCAAAACTYAQGQKITFGMPDLYPEGMAYSNKNKLFYVSSVRTGEIGTVDMQGNYKELYEDKTIKSGNGMKVDEEKNRLWFCAGDPNYSKYSEESTHKKQAHLICLNLATGRKELDVDLAGLYVGEHFANDLATDGKGNIYM